ncbi:hypothetical protein CU097_013246 [Rhizopus azygosporus]|uniref:Uncharacterized protein n=1 Tax=Rhizopus azygosporus TaxID=86630 RepID=A0A367K4Y4_RHIAZ|nr:hypothetical protein CU097_013246 [Rhizopus azygosporus]
MNKTTQFPIDKSHYDLLIIGPSISLCIIALLGAFQWVSKRKVETKFVQSRLHRLPCLFLVLNIIVASCLVVDCLTIAIRGVLDQFNIPLSFIYYCTTSLFAWCANLVLLLNNNTGRPKLSIIQCFFWVNTTCIDSVIEWLWIKDCLKHKQADAYGWAALGAITIRCITEFFIVWLLCFNLLCVPATSVVDFEAMPLLKPSSTTVTTIEIMVDGTKIIRTKTVKRLKKKGVILETFGLTLHIWPYHSLKLQLFAALSVLLMLANLAVNIWLPYKIGLITDGDMKEGQFAWLSIVVYVGLIYLQGHLGILQSLQNAFWAPVNSYMNEKARLFISNSPKNISNQLSTMSSDNVVHRIDLFNKLIFRAFPMLMDIILVSLFCVFVFAPIFGILLFVTVAIYMAATLLLMEQQGDVDAYDHSEQERENAPTSVKLRITQTAILTVGSLAGSLLFAYKVSLGEFSSGMFVTYSAFLVQLCQPLYHFGGLYKVIHRLVTQVNQTIEPSEVIKETVKYIKPDSFNRENKQVLQDNVGQMVSTKEDYGSIVACSSASTDSSSSDTIPDAATRKCKENRESCLGNATLETYKNSFKTNFKFGQREKRTQYTVDTIEVDNEEQKELKKGIEAILIEEEIHVRPMMLETVEIEETSN